MDDYYEKKTDEMSKEEKDMYGDYEGKMAAEEDVRTLVESVEIKNDKERYKRAMACAKHKAKSMNEVSKEDK